MFGFAEVALIEGDLDAAVRGFEEVLAIARELGQPWSLAWALATSGAWHVATGDGARARAELGECLALRQTLRDDRGTADTLGLLACLASAEGAFDWSARLHGAAEIGQQANAVTIWPFFQPLHDESVQRLREALGAARLDQLWRGSPGHPDARDRRRSARRPTLQPRGLSGRTAGKINPTETAASVAGFRLMACPTWTRPTSTRA